jgi:hypothetical protein
MTKPSVLWPEYRRSGTSSEAGRQGASHTATAAAAPKLYLDDNGSTVLNEVKEIIHLPEFIAKSASNQDKP